MKAPLFRERHVIALIEKLRIENEFSEYLLENFTPNEDEIIINKKLEIDNDLSLDPKKSEVDNAIELYEKTLNMNRTDAADGRIWAYLSHVLCRNYMQQKYPIEDVEEAKRAEYLIRHWFINGSSSRAIFDHGIASLWWSVFITIDPERADKYELTREWFSMKDYSRVMGGSQARSRVFLHSFLEYVINNENLFKEQKESKVRYLMRMMNRVGGHANLPMLTKKEIHAQLDKFRSGLEKIKSRKH